MNVGWGKSSTYFWLKLAPSEVYHVQSNNNKLPAIEFFKISIKFRSFSEFDLNLKKTSLLVWQPLTNELKSKINFHKLCTQWSVLSQVILVKNTSFWNFNFSHPKIKLSLYTMTPDSYSFLLRLKKLLIHLFTHKSETILYRFFCWNVFQPWNVYVLRLQRLCCFLLSIFFLHKRESFWSRMWQVRIICLVAKKKETV